MNFNICVVFQIRALCPFLTARFEPEYLQFHEGLQLTYPRRVSHEVDVKQEPLEESQPFPQPQQQREESHTYSIPMEYVCVMCRQRPVNCIFHPCAHLACTFCASQNVNCICACAIKTVTRFAFQ